MWSVRYTVRALGFLALLGILFGCALGDDVSNTSGACGAQPGAVEAFTASGLHGELRANCAACHSTQTNKAPSAFADSSSQTAYPYAKRFADLKNPGASFFIQRMNQGHECGSHCNQLASSFATEIDAWAKEEAKLPPVECGIGSGLSIKTATMTLPKDDLAKNATKNLKFDLNQAQPPVDDAQFQVTIKRLSDAVGDDPGSYYLYNPTVAMAPRPEDPKANVRITRVNILTELNAELYRVWAGVDFVIVPKSFNPALPLTELPLDGAKLLGSWSDGSTIAVQFQMELTTDKASQPTYNPFICKAEGTFNTNVLGIFTTTQHTEQNSGQSRTCVSCHKLGNNNFAVEGAGVNPCQEVKRRADVNAPAASLVLTYPASNNHSGGRFIFNQVQITNFTNWANAER